MFLRTETISPKKLVGQRIRMSLSDDRTGELWKGFMPRRKDISNQVSTDLFCVQVYHTIPGINPFNPNDYFDKWAATEVTDFNRVPSGMETFLLPAGLYAVFLHIGAAATGAKTFQYIFETWLPGSGYATDNRPHFELLGGKYKNDQPDSEEEIWIPVKPKE